MGTSHKAEPCAKLAAPAKVVVKDAQPFVSMDPGAVVGGCPASLLKLTQRPDGTLAGNWRDGRDVSLRKQ